ncbi:uncharacterized protein LOC116258423 isoform X1 [Nymphaea colorata]|nr:uncharacterized protein LOC116258423 isoform X1 [Nymphaea colorata]XP_049934928.1 uncharacterized protein LOC116258423 isoform X1 [Nymphaea colorata]
MKSHHLIGIKTPALLCIVLILFIGDTNSNTIRPSWFSKLQGHGSLFAVGHELGDRSVLCGIDCRNEFVISCFLEKYGKLPDYGFHGQLAKELCDISNGEWQIGIKPTFKLTEFQRFLVGEGSHRQSVSSIKYQIQPNLVTDHPGQPCELVLVERLGPGVFADPFELQRLVQRGVFMDAAVFGDTNLELPSALSNQSVVEVRVKINHVSDSNSREHGTTVTLPLHARYPPLGEGSFSTVEIGSPDMMIRCKHQVASYSWALYSLDSKSGEDILLWMVPRGKESHASFVSVVTAGSALLSAFVIVLASVYSLQMREKS